MNTQNRIKSLSIAALIVAASFYLTLAGCGDNEGISTSNNPQTDHRLIVIGFDGMDYKLLKNLMSEGKLPTFKKLSEEGDFKALGTSIPPQSPVAWSNFITGMNPGGHGIFDFIHRDPETMFPYLSTSKTEQAEKTVTIGKWVIPLSSGEVKLLRQGKAFWEYLTEDGIPTTIFRVPANFPTTSNTEAKQISGMGTPDIQGTYGTFSYYTDNPPEDYSDISGGEIFPVRVKRNVVKAKLPGPLNTFKKNAPESKVEFKVYVDPDNPVAKIVVQDQEIILQEGEWSDWVKIKYSLVPYLQSTTGIVRFYVKELHPDFKIYVSPVNIDPSAPALPISTPDEYAEELANEIGLFYTQGIPEDTKALSEEVLTDHEFLEQTDLVMEEEMKMLVYELEHFKSGMLFFYIGRVDQLSHMFWRTMDPKHPAYDSATKLRQVIENGYIEMDGVLAQILEKVDDNTTIIVLSDHGFAPFYRAFNLNTWLSNEGYVTLTDDEESEFFQNVDWSSTKAYGVGFNGLYINQKGREREGIVETWNKDKLLDEISEKLLKIRDPKNGEQVISRVYRASEVYSGPHLDDAPDLVVGYNAGYRASWETVLGSFPKETLRDNTEKWSGDHLMEARLVPGIVISNKKIQAQSPALYDIAPTILSEFDIPKQEGMIGNNIFISDKTENQTSQ
ncbi:MAG: alkaline phosphatase family protein [Thermodesulfobacteriota bacterium]